MRWFYLVLWLAICFGVAGISGMWTAREIPGWYRTLKRPSFSPPNWIVGPVWTVLYAMMAVAVWMVATTDASTPNSIAVRSLGVSLFLIQLALNFAWSWIFFRKHWLGAAAIEIVLLWLAIGATVLIFRAISQWAMLLMIPYLAWVTFASVLNLSIWHLNREPIRSKPAAEIRDEP